MDWLPQWWTIKILKSLKILKKIPDFGTAENKERCPDQIKYFKQTMSDAIYMSCLNTSD